MINITVKGGTSKRLLTGGKYCSEDIVVTAEGGGSSDDMAGALASRTITDFSSSSCTAIGAYSFRGCTKLKSLVAPYAKSVGEYSLYQCSALKSIVLPSVTTIATNSFREASNLEVIDLPRLTAIPTTAFYGCRSLKALILRSKTMVPLSGTSAFTQCYRILGTKNSGYNPTGEKIGFIYVPKALLEEYKIATNWADTSLVTQLRTIEDWPEITGENLFLSHLTPGESYESGGFTFLCNADGSFTVSGTNTTGAETLFTIMSRQPNSFGGMMLSGGVDATLGLAASLYDENQKWANAAIDFGAGVVIPAQYPYISIGIRILAGATVNRTIIPKIVR